MGASIKVITESIGDIWFFPNMGLKIELMDAQSYECTGFVYKSNQASVAIQMVLVYLSSDSQLKLNGFVKFDWLDRKFSIPTYLNGFEKKNKKVVAQG